MQKNQITFYHWFTLIILGIIWGSSFILIKRALVTIDPARVAMLRITITAIALGPYTFKIWNKFNLQDWYKYLLVGLTTTGIPSFCFAFAQKFVVSSTAGILNSLTPIFTLLISVIVFNAKFQWSKLLGVIIGFTGAGLLIYGNSEYDGSSSLWGSLIVISATICYGFNANIIKEFFPNTNSLQVSAGAFTLVSIPLLVYMIFDKGTHQLFNENHLSGLGWVSILAILCTLLANIFFFDLVQKTNPVFASSVTFLIPVVATLWGIWDGESLNLYHFFAMIGIITALILLRN